MKKRKIKLFASLTSLVMVVAVMAVGIWAATQANVTINASATFAAATHIKATIAGQWDETVTNGAYTSARPEAATNVVFDGVGETTTPATGTLELGNAAVSQTEVGAVTISYTITFTNDASTTDKAAKITISVSGVENFVGTIVPVTGESNTFEDNDSDGAYTVTLDNSTVAGQSASLQVTYTFAQSVVDITTSPVLGLTASIEIE